MEERDPIDDVFKDRAEQQSFDVPDSFLKDLDSRLDELDGKRKSRKFWWFLLLFPLGILCYFTLFSNETTTNKKVNQTSQERSKKIEAASDDKSNEELLNKETSDAQIILENTNGESLITSEPVAALMNTELVKTITINKNESKMTQSNGLAQTQSKSKNMAQEGLNELENPQVMVNDTEATNGGLSQAVRNGTSVQQLEEKAVGLTMGDKVEVLNPNTDNAIKPTGINLIATSEEVGKDTLQSIEPGSTRLAGQEMSKNEGTVFDPNSQSNLEAVQAIDSSLVNDAFSATVLENNKTAVDTLKTKVSESTETTETTEASQTLAKERTVVSGTKSTVGADVSKWSHEIQLSGGVTNSISRPTIMSNTSLWGGTFGVAYNLSIKNFDLGLGVTYNTTGENYSFPIINSVFLADQLDSVNISFVFDSVYNPNQQIWEVFTDSIPIVDSIFSPVYENETTYNEGKNKLHWINIPLRFGYRFKVGSFTLIPRVGFDFGFAAGANNSLYQVLMNELPSDYQSRRFVLSYALQIEVRREFERLHVFINPFFQSNVTPAVTYDLQNHRYNNWGINAGIGFVINPSQF